VKWQQWLSNVGAGLQELFHNTKNEHEETNDVPIHMYTGNKIPCSG